VPNGTVRRSQKPVELEKRKTRIRYGNREIGAENGSQTILKMGIYKTMNTTSNIIILFPASPEQTQVLAREQGALIFDLRPQSDEVLWWATINENQSEVCHVR
jgi:hypothetical protein